MGERGRSITLAWACIAVLGCTSLRSQDAPVLVDLSCKIAMDPGRGSGRPLKVTVSRPDGIPIREAYARAGKEVRFKRLQPGIFVACVEDRAREAHCESVDLYPPPGARTRRFSIQLRPPARSPDAIAGAQPLYEVDVVRLAVPKKARREFGKFEEDSRSGKIEESIRHLERALAIHPEYPEALLNLGSSTCMAGDYARAAQLFEKVTEVAPEMYAGWLNLGVTLLMAGDPRGGLQAEKRALTLRPDDPFVLYQLGLCYYRLGEFEAARRSLERVVELDPCSATYPHLYLARIALIENDKDKAAELLREVSRLHPYAPHPPGMNDLVTQLARVPKQ